MKVDRIIDSADHISPEAVQESATNLVPASSVLVVTRSGILRHTLPVAVTQRAVALNQDLKALIPADGIEPAYVAWALRASANLILRGCAKSGTTVSNLDTARLLAFRIPLAPVAEQRRIVAAIEEHVSRLDSGTRTIAACLNRLDQLHAALLENALNESDGHASLAIADLVAGTTIGLDRARAQQSNGPGEGTPYLRMQNVTADGRLDLTEVTYVRVSDSEVKRFSLQPGDLIFNTRNSRELVGKVALATDACDGWVYNNNLMRIRIGDCAEPAFVWLAMWRPSFRRSLDQVKRTTTNVAAIYAKDLLPLKLPMPPREEQRRIVIAFERQSSLIASLRAALGVALKRGEGLRRVILGKAFRGELVPQDPDDESARVLLDRIASERASSPKTPRSPRKRTAA
jgi:type I restriction enzyme S subunit